MRKVVLLAFMALALALALPTASLANTTTGFTFDTCATPTGCTLLGGHFSTNTVTYSVHGTGVNSGVTFSIALTGIDCATSPICTITGGSMTATNSATGLMVTSTLTGGGRIIENISNGVTHDVLNGLDLTPSTGLGQVAFGTLNGTINFNTRTGDVLSGRVTSMGAVNTSVPEPGMLGMLASGMIGFAGMARRRLKFWA